MSFKNVAVTSPGEDKRKDIARQAELDSANAAMINMKSKASLEAHEAARRERELKEQNERLQRQNNYNNSYNADLADEVQRLENVFWRMFESQERAIAESLRRGEISQVNMNKAFEYMAKLNNNQAQLNSEVAGLRKSVASEFDALAPGSGERILSSLVKVVEDHKPFSDLWAHPEKERIWTLEETHCYYTIINKYEERMDAYLKWNLKLFPFAASTGNPWTGQQKTNLCDIDAKPLDSTWKDKHPDKIRETLLYLCFFRFLVPVTEMAKYLETKGFAWFEQWKILERNIYTTLKTPNYVLWPIAMEAAGEKSLLFKVMNANPWDVLSWRTGYERDTSINVQEFDQAMKNAKNAKHNLSALIKAMPWAAHAFAPHLSNSANPASVEVGKNAQIILDEIMYEHVKQEANMEMK